jgi:hypothetical protein
VHEAESNRELKPFKGAESYETADADLFYGRNREAQELIALILSSRLTVLQATSGAGKTSLLNARVIPGLHSAGWLPVRVRPGYNPVGEVKLQTLKSVIPYPAAEAEALRRAASWSGTPTPPSVTTHGADCSPRLRRAPLTSDR